LTGNRISHATLTKGGTLHFEMATKAATGRNPGPLT
jgi:hypothetical protein